MQGIEIPLMSWATIGDSHVLSSKRQWFNNDMTEIYKIKTIESLWCGKMAKSLIFRIDRHGPIKETHGRVMNE